MDDRRVKVRCTVKWAQTKTPDKDYGKYGLDACNLSPKAVAAIEALGIEVRDGSKPNMKGTLKPENGMYVSLKQKTNAFQVVDTDGTDIEDELGNGTVADVVIFPSFMGKATKVTGKISRVIVRELVPYTKGAVEDDSEAL